MFESYTYEKLLEEVLNNAPDDIDTRPGSIYYDAISGILIKIAKSYTDIDLIFSLSQPDTAAGEYLDAKASEYGITRHKAEKARCLSTLPLKSRIFSFLIPMTIFTVCTILITTNQNQGKAPIIPNSQSH